MSKPVKNKYLGARIDEATNTRIGAYIEAADTNMGDLVRDAVDEYIINHPATQPAPPEQEKPDEPSVPSQEQDQPSN